MDEKSTLDKPRILIVDDEKFYLSLLSDALSSDYRLAVAKNGEQALARAASEKRPSLILLDVVMPDMDGYETCRRLKENVLTREIPVIFLTSRNDEADELAGFELGAVDYITKPISISLLKIRVKSHLSLAEQRFALEQLVMERTLQVSTAKDAVVYSMAAMAEARDNETGNHIIRTKEYVRLLANELSKTQAYENILSPYSIDLIYRAAPLHDIGKIGVPDRILLKPGPLDEDERREMDRHVKYGRDTIAQAEKDVGSTPFMQVAKELVYSHHEKWDGSGYPLGLKGKAIPLSGRLMAVADVYDALVSKRHYKEEIPHGEVVTMICDQAGKHFDPDLVAVFEQIEPEFYSVWERFQDGDIE